MASEQTWARGSGLVIPDRRLQVWDAESTGLTQAGPRPGSPVAQQQGPAHLKAAGTQTAGSELRVRTQIPGFAHGRASYVWRRNGDSLWRGWDAPSVLTHSEFLTWTDASGDLKSTRNPHAVTLADHTVIVAYDEHDDSKTNKKRVVVQVRDPVTNAWGAKVEVYGEPTSSYEFLPCLLVLPSGRVLLYHFVYNASKAQIRVQYSDDDGATWAVGNPYALEVPLDVALVSLHRIRAATGAGSTVVLVWTDDATNDAIQQYASADNGLTLDLIQSDFTGGVTGAAAPDVIWTGARFVAFWVSADRWPYCAPLGNAYSSINSADQVQISSALKYWCNLSTDLTVDAELAAVADESGTIYVYGQHTLASDYEGEVVRSADHGASWAALGQSAYLHGVGAWFSMEDSAARPTNLAATTCQGRVLVLANHVGFGSNEDDSISALYLGGWSTVTMPAYDRYPDERTRVCWERTWLPYDLPAASGWWTKSGAGSPSLVAPGAMLNTAANTYYYRVPSGTPAEGLIVCFALKLVSGGSLTADDCSVLLQVEDGTESYDAVLRFDGTGVRVWDPHNSGGTQVGSDITDVDPNDGIAVLAAIKDGRVSVWVRPLDGASDRSWYEGVIAGSLVDGGAGTTHRIEWGNRSGTIASAEWHYFLDTYAQWVGLTGADHLANGQDNPEQIMGRAFSGDGTYTADGVVHVLDDGPTIRADEWNSDVQYDFAMQRLHSEEYASPRLSWRSTSIAQQSIALKWDDVANTYPSDLLAVALVGHNIPKLKVELRTGAGWVWSQTIDLSHSIAYTRLGAEVSPAGSGADEPFLNRHEAAGWTMVLTDATTTVARRVDSNPQGKWTDDTTRQTQLRLVGVDGTEGNTHAAGKLVPSSCVILIPLRGVQYKAIRLTPIAPVAATDPMPAEDYWEIGTLCIGEVVANAETYSWGRTLKVEHGRELVTQRDRTRRSHRAAPSRREVVYGFVDGDDLTDLLDLEADPDFVELDEHASAVPSAVSGGAAYGHEGIYRELEGHGDVLTYLQGFDAIPAGVAYSLILDPEAHLLARITSGPYQDDVILGREGIDEVRRGTEVILTEEK